MWTLMYPHRLSDFLKREIYTVSLHCEFHWAQTRPRDVVNCLLQTVHAHVSLTNDLICASVSPYYCKTFATFCTPVLYLYVYPNIAAMLLRHEQLSHAGYLNLSSVSFQFFFKFWRHVNHLWDCKQIQLCLVIIVSFLYTYPTGVISIGISVSTCPEDEAYSCWRKQ